MFGKIKNAFGKAKKKKVKEFVDKHPVPTAMGGGAFIGFLAGRVWNAVVELNTLKYELETELSEKIGSAFSNLSRFVRPEKVMKGVDVSSSLHLNTGINTTKMFPPTKEIIGVANPTPDPTYVTKDIAGGFSTINGNPLPRGVLVGGNQPVDVVTGVKVSGHVTTNVTTRFTEVSDYNSLKQGLESVAANLTKSTSTSHATNPFNSLIGGLYNFGNDIYKGLEGIVNEVGKNAGGILAKVSSGLHQLSNYLGDKIVHLYNAAMEKMALGASLSSEEKIAIATVAAVGGAVAVKKIVDLYTKRKKKGDFIEEMARLYSTAVWDRDEEEVGIWKPVYSEINKYMKKLEREGFNGQLPEFIYDSINPIKARWSQNEMDYLLDLMETRGYLTSKDVEEIKRRGEYYRKTLNKREIKEDYPFTYLSRKYGRYTLARALRIIEGKDKRGRRSKNLIACVRELQEYLKK